MDDLVNEFITETMESLALLDSELVKLEQNPGDEAILGNIFRIVHTIKGTCGFLGLPRLESVAHAAENVLGKIRDKKLDASPQAISLVLRSLDAIKMLVEHLSQHGSEATGDDAGLIAELNAFAEGKTTPVTEVANSASEDLSGFFKGDDDLDALIAAQGASALPPSASPIPPTVAAPAPAVTKKEETRDASGGGATQSIRVNLDVLEHLMQTVSELVLARNQLLQVARTKEDRDFLTPLQHLSHVTTELQEGVMKTRMQPISNAWSKFPRLVRDLSLELGKKIELTMIGEHTELDRQLLELIKDPLTHMVRNSCDHGLEKPADRVAAGKSETGNVTLSAYHEGGHIIIDIEDDGRGLNLERIKQKALANGVATQADIDNMSDQQIMQFIFAAGFSTAEKVTAVSGRGVGMDVVRTNIEKMGGSIELSSQFGRGSKFSIRIPLTLAIVSVLIVEAHGEKFAVPQINVTELVRVGPGSEYAIESIHGAPVLRLREQLLPLGALSEILKLQPPADWTQKTAFIAVCKAGNVDFGIIVDRVHDMEEIVVKPVGGMLKSIPLYAGNTILGDGNVIMILDPGSLAREISDVQFGEQRATGQSEEASIPENHIGFLLVSAGQGAPKAVPLELVLRLEEIEAKSIEQAGGDPVVQYRGGLMQLTMLDAAMTLPAEGVVKVIVFQYDKKTIGLVVESIIDITHAAFELQMQSKEKGYLGSMIINGQTADVVDISQLIGSSIGMVDLSAVDAQKAKESNLLLVEDSPFFRNITQPFLAAVGYRVAIAENGAKALQLMKEDPSKFHLVITDIEMPVMNGFELARACKANSELSRIPLIAYTSKVGTEIQKKCQDAGIGACIAKTDREGLLEALSRISGMVKEAA
ncbi:MAG: chemotaxis protein CheW [Pseudomonadota bacterium]|nr:chemotaxis protein CheW [Pseudomonadota bacterium]